MKLLICLLPLLVIVSDKGCQGVIGGEEIRPHTAPYTVGIMYNHFGLYDGGSILDPTHILTSAYACDLMIPPAFYIIAGAHNIKANEKTQQIGRIEKLIKHESFVRGKYAYNICIIKLTKPLTFNKYVSATPLPKSDKTEYQDSAQLLGWGYTGFDPNLPGRIFPSDLLLGATLPIVDDVSCKKTVKTINETSQFCAGNSKFTSCNEDFGGPLMCTTKTGTKEQCGIASFYGAYLCRTISLYTKVGYYLDWIQEQLKQ